MHLRRLFFIFATTCLLSSCASLGKGVMEAFLEKQEAVDTRQCEIRGPSFSGIQEQFKTDGKIKVLMTHGVGHHAPGYATEFSEKLAQALNLTIMGNRYKNIALRDPFHDTKKLGNLRISHFLNQAKTQELVFYEFTWSEITAAQKEVLAYDNSGTYSFHRAELNNLLKKFSNDTGPDPIIYLGESRSDILTAFAQSFCWMSNYDWHQLPEEAATACHLDTHLASRNIAKEDFAFISHSLGSRITIDGFQKIAELMNQASAKQPPSVRKALFSLLRDKQVVLYMMSNQLPMLQLGRSLPEISGKTAAYCRPNGAHYAERMLTKAAIVAFSDPNDILSYAIPPGFVEKYLDSRLCMEVTNVSINVAKVIDAFGFGKMANPLDAHIGYDTDDRVVALIAKGIGQKNTADIVNQRCQWIETIDD
jgi:hypothetical protein